MYMRAKCVVGLPITFGESIGQVKFCRSYTTSRGMTASDNYQRLEATTMELYGLTVMSLASPLMMKQITNLEPTSLFMYFLLMYNYTAMQTNLYTYIPRHVPLSCQKANARRVLS